MSVCEGLFNTVSGVPVCVCVTACVCVCFTACVQEQKQDKYLVFLFAFQSDIHRECVYMCILYLCTSVCGCFC